MGSSSVVRNQENREFNFGSPILVREHSESRRELDNFLKDDLPPVIGDFFNEANFKLEDESENFDPLASVDIAKCSCHSTWCQSCFVKYTVPRMRKHLDRMDWRKVRFIMLSIDPVNFDDGEKAYEYLQSKKAIANMIHNLKRTAGVVITDWLWFLEWHIDGFAHYHLFVEVKDAGSNGMIGGGLLRKYWPYGRVTEGYVHDATHWNRLIGYFDKHGYFERKFEGDEKSHQVTLPEWARKYKRNIRRFSGMHIGRGVEKELVEVEMVGEWDVYVNSFEAAEKEQKDRRTYEEILSDCGSSVVVQVEYEGVQYPRFKLLIPYKQFKEENKLFTYVPGRGLHIKFAWDQLERFIEEYRDRFEVNVEREKIYDFRKG